MTKNRNLLEVLDLEVKIYNTLNKIGIRYVEQIFDWSYNDLSELSGIGKKSAYIIFSKLQNFKDGVETNEEPIIHELYSLNKEVICLKCNHYGAIQFYGHYYPKGMKKEGISSYAKYRHTPILTKALGFGGTIPHECTNCNNIGLIDYGGLEGYKQAFKTITKNEKI